MGGGERPEHPIELEHYPRPRLLAANNYFDIA